MDTELMLKALRVRAPWRHVASAILKAAGIPVGRGFKDTYESIEESGLTEVQATALERGLLEHLVVGEKLLRIYRIPQAKREALRVFLSQRRKSPNPLTNAFPGIANDLAQGENGAPAFARFVEFEHGSAGIYTSVRSYLQRVELSRAELTAAASRDYEKIIGVRKLMVHAYDTIWVPHDGKYICIAADYPSEAPHDFANSAITALEFVVRQAAVHAIEPINLWPAIEGLYAAKDGKFVHLSFKTDNESVKTHKSRGGRKCLREDEYHKGGANNVDEVSPYRVAVQWTRSVGGVRSVPEVELPGTARDSFSANAFLGQAVLRHCLNERDMAFVLSKLFAHLP